MSSRVKHKLVAHARQIGHPFRLDLVDYKFGNEVLCQYPIGLLRQKAKSSLRKRLLDECVEYASVFFDANKEEVINSHESVCTNDCLTSFKYEYEFMTNFDFDELLFPRRIDTNNYSTLLAPSTFAQPISYDIYEYSRGLVDAYGSHACGFHFEHVMFVDNFNYTFIQQAISRSQFVYYRYHNKNQFVLRFKLLESDEPMILFLEKSQPMLVALNETVWTSQKKLDDIWKTPFAIRFNVRFGKSLFVSQLTELYTQHSVLYISNRDAKEMITVPLSQGFSSHFREKIEGFFDGKKINFNNFIVDLEYYQFLRSFNLTIDRIN